MHLCSEYHNVKVMDMLLSFFLVWHKKQVRTLSGFTFTEDIKSDRARGLQNLYKGEGSCLDFTHRARPLLPIVAWLYI